MAKIYISSTYSDLKEHREKVYRALRQMRHDVIAMEDYVARDERPLETCLADVADCDIYIGIFAWRYGFIPSENNPEGKSITELEYRKSVDTGKSPLIFLLNEQASWHPQLMDAFTGENGHGQRINALRQELALKYIVSHFMTAEELASLVGAAVSNWERQQNIQRSDDPSLRMQTKYLEQVYNYYSSVKLPVGPEEGFSLAAIFQPLTLRRDPLAAEDLERERRRFLLGEDWKGDDGQQKHIAPHGMRPSPFMHELVQGTTVDNAEEALKRSSLQRIVILGGSGTGKTTTLKFLVASQAQKVLANPTVSIPIFLSLAALTRSEKSLQSYLLDIVEDMKVDRDYAHVLWREIQQGRAFVCLDSLDEVDPRQRGEVIDWINRKAGEPGNIWIIGSRFTEYKGGQFRRGQFIEWELQPMERPLRQELAHRLFSELQRLFSPAHRVPLIAATFVRSLENHPQAAAWCENPLLFSLAAVVYVKKGELPSSRTLLYQNVIEAILQTRESDPVRCELLLRMLTELALWLHRERGRTFTSTDLVTFFMDVQRHSWGAAPELIHQVINSGILEVVAHHTYGFRHQTFQEYLSAVELARLLTCDDHQKREATLKFIWSKRTYSRWVEVLRLMVGILVQRSGKRGVQTATHWLQELLRQRATTEGDPGNLGLILALTSLGEIGEMVEWHTESLIHLQKDIVSTWVEELLQTSQKPYSTKVQRLQQVAYDVSFLHKNAVKVTVDRLVETLNHIYSGKRTTAVQALGGLGERVPLEPLLEALHDEDWGVRRQLLGHWEDWASGCH